MNTEFITKLFQSYIARGVLLGLGISAIVLAIFQLGMIAGYHKAAFAFNGADNYYATFGRHDKSGVVGKMIPMMPHDDFDNSHGVVGKIINVNLPVVTVQDENQTEKSVLVKDDTTVRRFRETLKPSDIKVNDRIVVIGESNDAGQIDAKLVRVMPEMITQKQPMKSGKMPKLPFLRH